jgi:two-component system, sensor histidine kinase PdtaS
MLMRIHRPILPGSILRAIKLLPALVLLAVMSNAQQLPGIRTPVPGEENELLAKLANSQPGTAQIEILLDLGTYYLEMPGEEKADLELAMNYAKRAGEESRRFDFREGYIESLILTGTILADDEQDELSRPVLDSALFYLESEPPNRKFPGKPEKEIRRHMQAGKIYFAQRKFDVSGKSFLAALKLAQDDHLPVLHYIYYQLSVVETWKFDWHRSLFYALEAVKSMEATGDFSSAGIFYSLLGIVYRQVGQFQKSIDYYEMAYNFYKRKPSTVLFYIASLISEAFTKLNRPQDGIAQLNNKIRFRPPANDYEKREVEYSLATCYRVLKQYDSAEVHFLKLLALQRKDRKVDLAVMNKMLGQLYVEWEKYALAKPYLDKSLASGVFSKRALSHLYFMLFKADSAAGNYLAAMDHLMKNKKIDEVLYYEAKTRENQELQIKYETEKKEREINMQEKDILLLKGLTQLQQKSIEQANLKLQYDSLAREQSIKLLAVQSAKKDNELLLKQAGIKQATFQKNVTIAGLAFLLVILALLYNQYRIKQRNNKEISDKNLSLQHLLTEKEWLLKEVHHRVKNNLHTIVSLLETQSAYLKDDALLAIQNSQHRVFAMSLIHQKLYQTENSSNINMSTYLPELLHYLRNSFDVRQRIYFTVDIKDIHLDISKAIPVGLILNEAVTNSIKYAFPRPGNGAIDISMERVAENRIRLCIADNGIGLPSHWDTVQGNSLGLKLMRGLSEDIRGEFLIENANGTKIVIEFPEDIFIHYRENESSRMTALQL